LCILVWFLLENRSCNTSPLPCKGKNWIVSIPNKKKIGWLISPTKIIDALCSLKWFGVISTSWENLGKWPFTLNGVSAHLTNIGYPSFNAMKGEFIVFI